MRNAVATLDDDYGYEKPSRKKSAGKSRAQRKRPIGARFRFDLKKLSKIGVLGACAIGSVVIMVNALELQKGHHPAPLFGNGLALRQPAPKPSTEVAAPTALAASPAPATEKTVSPAPAAKPQHAAATPKDAGDDQIARLLGGTPSGGSAGKDDGQTVADVQRALVKLHLLPKVTGTMGPATKKAIAKFEKEQHLPVKGEISRRMVRVLAAQSGAKID